MMWGKVKVIAGKGFHHPPGGRLPLLSAKPEVTFPAAEHHRPLACTKFKQDSWEAGGLKLDL